ncbi:thiol reductant ABC exporter subunit CydC [Mangrovitalea sediminis]|uniref:thiol reductant ABC exporter subunit CydC n=1 Tax=Mangrovitalea sediminis TaxID=1982043 RepID=UPI0018EA19D2|nr:thiol reductant ABC exporter subunit CydC [Mangrovitalea sediminis]
MKRDEDTMAPENPQQAKDDLRRLLALYRPYWRWMAAGILLSLTTVLANIGLMAVAGWFIAAMAIAGAAGATLNYFTPAALIRAFAIVRTGGRYLERLVTHEATFRLLAELRVWFFTRIEPLAPARLGTLRGSDLLNRIQADIDSLNHIYLRVLVPVIVGAIGVVLIVGVMGFFSLPVAFTTFMFLLCAGVGLPWLLLRRGREPGRQSITQRAALRDTLVDGFQGLAELRVYGADASHADRADANAERLIAAQADLSRLTGWSQGVQILCATLAMWAALILAIPAVRSGTLHAPDIAMLALFVLASFEAVMPLPLAMQMLGESLAAARRIFTLVDCQPAVIEPEVPAAPSTQPDLRLEDVYFRYGEDRPWALEALNLDLPFGHRLAVVGASGAGKSSLLNLLVRFWDCQEGSIRLGGRELRDYAADTIRSQFAVLSQDPYLFNATIRENLLLARPDADQATLEAACRTAQLHDFLTTLPQGYDTPIGEAGARLSGGQARRLAIARALLLDAPILILDEPTEGLDTLTERDLLQAIGELMRGRSVLLITHRLGGLANLVDDVVVLENGKQVQQGKPAELAQSPGAYKTLHDALAGLSA